MSASRTHGHVAMDLKSWTGFMLCAESVLVQEGEASHEPSPILSQLSQEELEIGLKFKFRSTICNTHREGSPVVLARRLVAGNEACRRDAARGLGRHLAVARGHVDGRLGLVCHGWRGGGGRETKGS